MSCLPLAIGRQPKLEVADGKRGKTQTTFWEFLKRRMPGELSWDEGGARNTHPLTLFRHGRTNESRETKLVY